MAGETTPKTRGRPRKYNTAEEMREAVNKSAAKYREKAKKLKAGEEIECSGLGRPMEVKTAAEFRARAAAYARKYRATHLEHARELSRAGFARWYVKHGMGKKQKEPIMTELADNL